MSESNEIFSMRIVIADFYVEKPIFGLDPCYSEFRGREIKKVPIIRIFGSNADGQKTCMHVHGVFPYFYIPYESKDFESLNKALYQVAFNIDKAINISLGQAQSTTQHVFKIQLVKGIPFYGYHRREHQYLKIYMYNPRFVRRAANLLQNGSILGKVFHPHESHVPYILQFMIGYNLYGMSFLHVPLEIVKFRRNSDEDIIPFRSSLKDAQILSSILAKKQSISSLEVDVASNFILNRFQLITKSNENKQSNPGVEAIWHDEDIRRRKLIESIGVDELKINTVPPLKIPPTEERPNVMPTESDVFYRAGLISKLLSLENSESSSLIDQTMNTTIQPSQSNATLCNIGNVSDKEMVNFIQDTALYCKKIQFSTQSNLQRRTFNLKKILANSVYPAECTMPQDELIDASFIENHLSGKSFFETHASGSIQSLQNEGPQCNNANFDESVFLDETIVDEEMILNLTQQPHVPLNATLRHEDMEILDVLQQLEEQNELENPVDFDSSLAPLSQPHKDFDAMPGLLDKEKVTMAAKTALSDNESESDNEGDGHMHDFSIAMDDIDEILLKLSQSQLTKETECVQELPQMDGADDELPKTPEKSKQIQSDFKNQTTSPRTPKTPKNAVRSPRTPKSNLTSRYAALPLVITSRSVKKNPDQTSGSTDQTSDISSTKPSSPVPLQKKLALSKMRRKTISSAKELREIIERNNENNGNPIVRRTRKNSVDLEKTHITCALTPLRRSERLLKFCSLESVPKNKEKDQDKPKTAKQNSSKRVGSVPCRDRKKKSPSYRLRKLLIRLPRTDLIKLAEDFKKSNELTKTKQRNKIEYNAKTAEVESVPHNADKGEDSNHDQRITTTTGDPISRNLSELLKVFQTENNENEINSSNDNAVKAKTFRIKPLYGNAKHSPLSLSRYRIKKREKSTATGVETNSTGADENIKKNLSELMEALQTINQSGENQPNLENRAENNNDGGDAEDVDEIIDASDTEDDMNLKKIKGTPKLRHFISRNIFSPDIDSPSPSTSKIFDLSLTINSPSIFSEFSSPVLSPKAKDIKEPPQSDKEVAVRIEPLLSPPTYEEALKACCEELQIYEYEFPQPFYSNPADITKPKEIGFTMLKIPGNKVSDLPEFESVLGKTTNGGALAEYRRKKMLEIVGPEILQHYRSSESLREFFATDKKVIIEPFLKAPTRHDAKVWLKARELLKKNEDKKQDNTLQVDQDSPIKIKRQKVTMMFSDETGNGSGDADDIESTSCSLTLTPLTPGTPIRKDEEKKLLIDSTPLSRENEASSIELAFTSSKSRRRKMRLNDAAVRKSLNEKLKAAADKEMEKEEVKLHVSSLPSSQHSNISSNEDSSSISSQIALAELERSSFLKQLKADDKRKEILNASFGLSSVSLDKTFGFKVNLENLQEAKSDVECNNLTTMVMELFVITRDDLYPNPEFDEIRCIFYAIENNISTCLESQEVAKNACGYILVNDSREDIVQKEGKIHGIDNDIAVKIVKTEIEAVEALLELCALWDADIYAGYEIEMSSWGYLIDRAKFLCLNIAPLLSRVPSQKIRDFADEEQEQLTDLDVDMKLCGRILLDVWRLMRSEIALTSYTFENVIYHILHRRCPLHSHRDLTTWFRSPCSRWIVLEYYLERVRGIMELLDQLDLLGRTSEMAKLIGIQFYEVLSRGSQFRVESMMLRIAKPRNIVPLSPSVQQRAHMRAPEYLPLILEPQSRFYADPVIVLDFQSLYPSMIIAYNYCFSTCLGRVEHLGQSSPFEFGASQLRVSPTMLRKLIDEDLITISPCGVVFVKSSVREGILPRMLTEILNTRLMVKQSMKLHKSNSALQRILHSRQLALKLMANVTYGYTAANFSGRMPAVEVGDSVVGKGRETLERAIKMVETNKKWGAKVVYGDTDSMFVMVPGRNREQAFKIGEEIAEEATKNNPHPVKLKLEKVYQPCILQTKKRYVGYMYETPDQTDPVYEAKGIETVRRDGCPAVAKMLEKVLRILFETADVSQVKQYVCRQFTKILSGRANLQDLIFAKEFRGLNGYKPTACVPALELTRKWMQTDPRHIPRRGERVPFIITNGPPGVPLIRLVRSPHDVLADGGLKINSIYYITKSIIPPLNRCLLLIGADVTEWFANLPRKFLMTPALSTANELVSTSTNRQQKKSTISQYFSATNCVIECGRHTQEGICNNCALNTTKCVVILNSKISRIERAFHLTQQICQVCCGRIGDLKCKSLDCPVLFVLEVKRRDLQQIEYFQKLLAKF